jgi:serine protease DegQ
VVVTHVEKNSPADNKGLERYDIITHVNNRSISSMSQLNNILGILAVEKEVRLRVSRGGEVKTLTIPLSENSMDRFDGDDVHSLLEGIKFKQIYNKYEQPMGLIIADIDSQSRGYQRGLREGDMIFGVNRYRIRDKESATEAASLTKKLLRLRAQRGYQELRITLYR